MSIKITFLDVGNGDSIVISHAPGAAIIVDVKSVRRLSRWLEEQNVTLLDCIYFTHEHQDHFPSLVDFETFISNWLQKESAQIKYICLPTEIIRNANLLVNSSNVDDVKKRRLRHSLDKLELWQSTKTIEILRAEQDDRPRIFGDVQIYTLHPSFTYFERQNAKQPNKINETSVVLRIDYGNFKSLLLADIELSGIAELLSRYQSNHLNTQLVKIPHHGAWPSNSHKLSQLLRVVDPEIAILSVGSTNQHGHVVPDLFKELLELKHDPAYRLEHFVCTEITRSCLWNSLRRKENRRTGLDKAMPCAGDISITAELNGTWTRENQVVHTEFLNTIGFAACQGRLDFKAVET